MKKILWITSMAILALSLNVVGTEQPISNIGSDQTQELPSEH
jgi:hypothetical protein